MLLAAALPIAAVAGCLVSIWFGLSTLAVTLPDVVNAFPAAPYALDGSRDLAVANVVAAGGTRIRWRATCTRRRGRW